MDRQVVMITGGARGIGMGIAECLAARNMDVVLADVREEQAGESALKLAEEHGVETMGVACDVTSRESVAGCLEQIVERFGQLDVLVNNAGICPFESILEMSEETFRRTLDVNLVGAFHCTQLAAKQMIRQGRGGRVVFITSLAVNVCGEHQGDYAASKAGMHMLMKSFAIALGKHQITCNAVAPGMIMTDMTRHHWEKPGPAAEIKERVPVGRIGTPRDIGNAVALLVGREADYINGVGLTVDGGHQAVCR